MALTINNNNEQFDSVLTPVHSTRVLADGGIADLDVADTLIGGLSDLGLMNKTELLICPEIGVKQRVDGILKYITDAYSVKDEANDSDQVTVGNQPYVGGDIASNERLALKNPNGDSRFMEHAPISFAANEPWTVTTVLNWNGEIASSGQQLFGESTLGKSSFFIDRRTNTSTAAFRNASGSIIDLSDDAINYSGKNSIIT